MMTHMCVDGTVRAAKDLGYTITLIGDACAIKDLELNRQVVSAREVQQSFLAVLNYVLFNSNINKRISWTEISTI